MPSLVECELDNVGVPSISTEPKNTVRNGRQLLTGEMPDRFAGVSDTSMKIEESVRTARWPSPVRCSPCYAGVAGTSTFSAIKPHVHLRSRL